MSFWSFFLILSISLVVVTLYWWALKQASGSVCHLSSPPGLARPSVSVIIPAYNEAANIQGCLRAVLQDQVPDLEVWVVDDQSTDDTQALACQVQDPRVQVIVSPPRPPQWVGKNWACTQGAQGARGDYLLFIDADVRLGPHTITDAVYKARQGQLDLLSLGPRVECGCLAEWLVQPLMLTHLLVAISLKGVNRPGSKSAFAAGPFMLFRREAYWSIGGHAAVAAEVVEDVELARRVQEAGLRLWFGIAPESLSVRMYPNFASLWEGWTKNLYQGTGRNPLAITLFIVSVLLVYVLPWTGLVALGSLNPLLTTLGGLNLASQYLLRRYSGAWIGGPTRYWWLSGLGGVLLAAMALTSVVKTETGWGWTWRGRQLHRPGDFVAQ